MLWSRIRWWKGVAEEITGSRCQPARAPVGGERTAAAQTAFTGSESDVRHSGGVQGGPLSGDFWSRIRWWKGVAEEIAWEQVSTSQKSNVAFGTRERSSLPQQTSFTGSESDVDILGAYGEALFGPLLWSRIRWSERNGGARNHWEQVSTSQSTRTGGERTAVCTDVAFTGTRKSESRHSGGVQAAVLSRATGARISWLTGVLPGFHSASRCQPARAPVGGERTAATPPDCFYGFRKRR